MPHRPRSRATSRIAGMLSIASAHPLENHAAKTDAEKKREQEASIVVAGAMRESDRGQCHRHACKRRHDLARRAVGENAEEDRRCESRRSSWKSPRRAPCPLMDLPTLCTSRKIEQHEHLQQDEPKNTRARAAKTTRKSCQSRTFACSVRFHRRRLRVRRARSRRLPTIAAAAKNVVLRIRRRPGDAQTERGSEEGHGAAHARHRAPVADGERIPARAPDTRTARRWRPRSRASSRRAEEEQRVRERQRRPRPQRRWLRQRRRNAASRPARRRK